MAWYDQDSWLTAAFSPSLSTIIITIIIAFGLPILIHSILYKQAVASTNQPTFLLVGPSGAGKTAFTILVRCILPIPVRMGDMDAENGALTSPQAERNTTAQTHTSTTPLTVSTLLPSPHVPASSHYRSPGDPAFERARRFLIVDTPGHGKLRHFATSQLTNPQNIQGIVFVVDAAAIAEESGLTEAAEYLHDVLLSLQKRYTDAKSSKGPREIPVLVAANKMDLFTALPASLVKIQLEKGITEVRNSRAKAIRDAGAALAGKEDDDEEKEWLGEGGEGAFDFEQMREIGTTVEVIGGNVISTGKQASDTDGWWGWIAQHL